MLTYHIDIIHGTILWFFPCDLHNYGKIEWVSWNQTPYPYEFEFSK